MKFRTRLLILLLSVALLPLALSFIFQRTSILHFGNRLAEDTRSLLNDSAVTLLHALVDDYGRILKRDRAMALLTLELQAQAVSNKLSQPIPMPPRKIYFSADYADPGRQPEGLTTSSKRLRPTEEGELLPIPVSFSEQVIFLAGTTKQHEVAEQLAKMSSMPDIYQTLHAIQPELFLWQYTALESGIHSSFPGKGGYPPDYDPRQRQWYKKAVAKKQTIQQILTDLTTGTMILTLATPIYQPDGTLAGVTALDIDYRQFFADWDIPADWDDAAESMVLIYHQETAHPAQQLEILLRNSNSGHSLDWKMPLEHEYLNLTDPQLDKVREDLSNGRSAVRKIRYQGQETLWAYGSRIAEEPFPLVIVPYDRILAKAVDAEKYVNRQISLGLTISAALTIVVVAAAVFLSVIRSRKVTQPIMQLAKAADQLAEGDFSARVEIRTGDELEELGTIFNELGSRLKDREQLKQSLVLAKEIQQQLLPSEPPRCPGFELAGRSLYCDETGGDYFDFIELGNSKRPRLGLAVGDVSGHGIGAALVMATARGALHSLADLKGSQLKSLYRELNRQLCRCTADAYFMTLFYGILEPEERTLYWISAGHAPLFLCKNAQVEELYSSGIPLGILEDTEHETAQPIQFSPGDLLLIGTDGIWEARNPDGEMFGIERVRKILNEFREENAATLVEQIVTALSAFRGSAPIDDDVTLVIIKAVETV